MAGWGIPVININARGIILDHGRLESRQREVTTPRINTGLRPAACCRVSQWTCSALVNSRPDDAVAVAVDSGRFVTANSAPQVLTAMVPANSGSQKTAKRQGLNARQVIQCFWLST